MNPTLHLKKKNKIITKNIMMRTIQKYNLRMVEKNRKKKNEKKNK